MNEYVYLPIQGDDPNRVGFTRKKVSELNQAEKKYREAVQGLDPHEPADAAKWIIAKNDLFEARHIFEERS